MKLPPHFEEYLEAAGVHLEIMKPNSEMFQIRDGLLKLFFLVCFSPLVVTH